jgi:hypothetical protein
MWNRERENLGRRARVIREGWPMWNRERENLGRRARVIREG